MNYTHILWDFNGTLFDDVEIGIVAVNELLRARNLPLLTDRDEYRRHFRFPIEEYYKSVGIDLERESFDRLAREWVSLYRAEEGKAGLCRDAEETLQYIKEKKIPQILFSASQLTMLKEQTDALRISEYFDEMLGRNDIYATEKIAVGLAWMERVKPKKAILIGDTEHDAAAARALGIDCVLIAGGHQTEETLRKTGFPVLSRLGELPAFLNL